MTPYAASSDLLGSWVASSGQISCQSWGRKSFLVTRSPVFSSILLQIAGPKKSLPFDDSIFRIYLIDVPHEQANSCCSSPVKEFICWRNLFIPEIYQMVIILSIPVGYLLIGHEN